MRKETNIPVYLMHKLKTY